MIMGEFDDREYMEETIEKMGFDKLLEIAMELYPESTLKRESLYQTNIDFKRNNQSLPSYMSLLIYEEPGRFYRMLSYWTEEYSSYVLDDISEEMIFFDEAEGFKEVFDEYMALKRVKSLENCLDEKAKAKTKPLKI